MTRRVGIIGYPLGHTISPAFQQAALDHLGLDVRYEIWETRPEALAERIRRLRQEGVLGFNVTLPHKEAIVPLLDGLEGWAATLGAVNTVVNRGDRLVGHNTDAQGFLRALKQDAGFDPKGVRVLMLGAGGSARAVAMVLAKERAVSIAIANRTLSRAEALAHLLKGCGPSVDAVPLEPDALAPVASTADLIVNCTTLGMRHGPAEHLSSVPSHLIPSTCLVYDLVYNPPETPLLREAKQAGARTLDGLAMLVYQGAASFELWTGRKAPVEVMFRAARQALG